MVSAVTAVPSRDQIAALARMAEGSIRPVLAHLDSTPTAAEAFCEFLAWHQLLGYANHALADPGLRPDLPEVLANALALHARKLAWKNGRLRAGFPILADTFDRAGVSFRVLKGLHFARAYYGGMNRRSFWDMDLLVRPGDFRRAQELLFGLGYRRTSRVFVSQRVSRIFAHAFDYRRDRSIGIDLHWRLDCHPGMRLDEQAIWDTSQAIEFEGRPFQVLSDTYALTFLLIGIVRDIERGALRLRSLVDLLLMLRAMGSRQDWPAFFEQREREGIARLCAATLGLFFTLFDRQAATSGGLRQTAAAIAPAPGEAQARTLLRPGRYAVNNKRWASRLYPAPGLAYAGWWVVSLPARLMIHRPGGNIRKPGNPTLGAPGS